MILLLVWLLMRFWDMSVHNKKKRHCNNFHYNTDTSRGCDTLHEKCCFGVKDDEVTREFINFCELRRGSRSRRGSGDSTDSSHIGGGVTGVGSYLKGANRFLRGLLAKVPLSQIFYDNNNNTGSGETPKLQSGLSISQLLAEFGGGYSLDPNVLRSELAFMGISEDLLFNRSRSGSRASDFQWSQEYSFDEDGNEGDINNLLVMSASYEDMAKHLDAHLAELDIESFRAEDINSILNLKSNMEFKSTSLGDCRRGRIEEEEEDGDLLFSPTSGGAHYLSTDSLDHSAAMMMDNSSRRLNVEEDGDELMESIRVSTNCQANKENYTLAFKDDSYTGSTDSDSSKESCLNEGRKVSWNKLGQSNNSVNQSLDSSGSFVAGWNMRRSPPTKETFQLSRSPSDREQQNINLVKIFMKQRTISTSSNDLPKQLFSSNTTDVQMCTDNEFSHSRYRKKSMNDSGKCSTLSQHVMDEEEGEEEHDHQQQREDTEHRQRQQRRLPPSSDDDYQLDSLDVVQSRVPQETGHKNRPQEGFRDKPQSMIDRRASKSIQTSKQFGGPEKVLIFPECRLPNLDFVHLEHEVMTTSQFVTGDHLNQLNGSHPHGFDHIVDWDSLLFLLSREHKEMLKRYPVLTERIRNSYQDSVSDVFDEFPESMEVTFDGAQKVCDCDSLISSTASNNSSNRYSSDSGLGRNNAYNFEDLRKLFVYEYNEEGESGGVGGTGRMPAKEKQPERRYRERRYTMCSMETPMERRETRSSRHHQHEEKRVSFVQGGLPKKRTNKSTSSIPRLIAKTVPIRAKEEPPKAISKIPKLIKSPSKANVNLVKI